jgi:hypothetical protein
MKVLFSRQAGTPLVLLAAILAPLFVVAVSSAQVVLPPIAPPKPAVARNPNATQIGTGDLSEAVNFAIAGSWAETVTSFNLFKQDWVAVGDEVRGQSTQIADVVDTAINEFQDLVDADPPPTLDVYAPAIRRLSDMVEEANSQLNAIAPATAPLRIPATDLAQSTDWARQGNLVKAHDEFQQFSDDWSLSRAAVRQASPAVADAIEVATGALLAIIANPANQAPSQSEYYPAFQALLQAVLDGNKVLATLGPAPAAAPGPATTAGPISIRTGDLDEAVEWAAESNLTRARSEFGQFQSSWANVKDAVRQRSAALADQIDAAATRAQRELNEDPAQQDEYFEALQRLQTAVTEANNQLGN